MPDCQSGAVHSLGCGTIIGIAVASEHSVFVTPIVTRGNAAKPCTRWAAAAVGAPVSFREKETGAGWRNEMAKRISCCRAARKEYELPQRALWKSRHPSHRCDRASRRTLIALGGEPPQCGVASKVLATWVLSRTALVRLWFSARFARGQPYFGDGCCANR